ncbi:MAG: AmmeMemoRadiSam system protein B [Prolixibacteraceae bacterium]|jgi:MEMO1 family protein|nr:AmmeMemoRadiSam system protein B [Prolixibacteraceae bacterium]MBT6766989.1 AmmeMemoRadiSam system protein B [Prolixibacteraceae bacterium]MBT6997943.1 AmmeMemoRadiSam system protein B [Prolixibacteraceae bacterium]MBT7396047.1 AmmeMemoRadiSam system protein B [Prolixibacteraceae bacterium]
MNWHLQNKNNRKASFAGKFYPASKKELTQQLAGFFRKAKKRINSQHQLQALIVPHAGYIFSGQIAASAYNQIPDDAKYKRVFVLASSHNYYFNGAAVYCSGNYITPLGELNVDKELANSLINSSTVFQQKNEAHNFEHSLEVQLPFLQKKLGSKFLLIPIILGTNSAEECEKIGKSLKPYFTSENLFIISTDFSHYPEYEDANKVDQITTQAICSNRATELVRVLSENKKLNIKNLATSLCGWTSVLTLMYLTEKMKVSYVRIDYQNSGDTKPFGDKNRVVGYGSIAIFNNDDPFHISEEEKKEILGKARASIEKFIKTGKRAKIIPPEIKGVLNKITGVFVSIYIKSELRGCIGNFADEKTLNELVQKMAVSATCDHRFDDLKIKDLENLELEISVLSPLKRIESVKEIELGKHGIYIKKGLNSGTFLPQVATKTGWDLAGFLGHCARDKAGLGWDGWKTADIFIYEAVIFRGT